MSLTGLRLPTLPQWPSQLIGRQAERALARQLISEREVRLLTLTGPGGSGKTRLAVDVAAQLSESFEGAVAFIDLSPIRTPELVIPSITAALGLRDTSRQAPVARLARALGNVRMLLVLDNFEQVIDGAADVAALLEACPALVVLATSREALRVQLEHRMPVPPLQLPDLTGLQDGDAVTLADVPSVALFFVRAACVDPDFTPTEHNVRVVAKLCTRLDGLPLAIELAAAHIGALPPQVQLERLTRRLKLPMRGSRDAPARQQTLHNTIAWSHDLLNVQERELFRRLAVFEGGVSLAAVEAVCWGDGLVPRHVLECLVALVDKNLLHAHDQPTPRYRMLETVREYAQEQLAASGEEELVRRRHADYFVTLAETGEMALIGGPAQAEWFLRFDTEQDNLRSALRWACSGADTNVGLRLAGAIGYFWLMSGRLAEGQEWLMGALGVARSAPPVLRSKALTLAAHIALLQGNLVLAQELSDAATPLANASGSPMERVRSLMVRALLERAREQHAHALELLDSATAELRGLGVEPPGIVRYQQANTMLRLGNIEQASSLHEATLADVLASGDKYMAAGVLADLGCIALFRADPEQALRRFRTAFTFACEVSELLAMAGCIEAIAQVHCRSKNYQMAVTLLGAADRICDLASVPPPGSDAFERMRWLPHGLSAPRLIESAREALGETAFDAAWAHGRALPPAQVTAYILPTQDVEPAPAGAVLTAREREVATLLARGLSNRQLAEHLVITTRTVENHLSHILDKLDLSSRTQIATWAMEHLIPRRGEGASGGAHDHARGRA